MLISLVQVSWPMSLMLDLKLIDVNVVGSTGLLLPPPQEVKAKVLPKTAAVTAIVKLIFLNYIKFYYFLLINFTLFSYVIS